MKRSLFFLLALALFSCGSKTIYNKMDEGFKDNRWPKSDVKTYSFELAKQAAGCSMDVRFSHVYGYQFQTVPLVMTITYPDGKTVSKDIVLKVTDSNGKDLGECAGDICDLTQTVITDSEPMPVGKYMITLKHTFQAGFLPNVLGVGIRVIQSAD
jgi:gliding motility-associated lipoprotein GldH